MRLLTLVLVVTVGCGASAGSRATVDAGGDPDAAEEADRLARDRPIDMADGRRDASTPPDTSPDTAPRSDGRTDAVPPSLGYTPNVLFIAIDDLNTWVGHLGVNTQALTPNIDRLAKRGVTFTRAYTAAPLCMPSRSALLSGRRPSSTGIYSNNHDWYAVVKDIVTLPRHFKENGYQTMATGKHFHESGGPDDSPDFWNEYFNEGGNPRPPSVPYQGVNTELDWGPLDAPTSAMADAKMASWAAMKLKQTYVKPFFLAVGFKKTHLPWYVPRKYFDMHPLDQIKLPVVKEDDLNDLPPVARRIADNGDHDQILAASATNAWARAVQAYLAAGTFVDEQIGVVLDALDASPHRDKTIVVLYGDHGWHLGQKHHWRKETLWEEATNAPLVWVVPGLTRPDGRSARTVDFMSIYPTLSELAGLPVPPHVEGVSLAPLLRNPNAAWDRPALTTMGPGNHAVRSEAWRAIRYRDGSEELYDHDADPYEWTNIAANAAHNAVKAQLRSLMPTSDAPPAP